jgi:hypothetical protein
VSAAAVRIGVAQRRARLAARHHLRPAALASSPAEVAEDLVALHGTDPASVYLAVWARTSGVDSAAVDQALYADRVLVRMLGMRRTMFVVPAGLAPVVQAACTDGIAERLRRGLARELQRAAVAHDAGGWLNEVCEATIAALTDRGGAATAAELADGEPRLRQQIVYAEGKNYGGPASISSRVLMLLSAEGRIIRGRPRGGWTSGQFRWHLPGDWLPGQAGALASPQDARAELARRWLLAFGPATLSDLQWWTGWTAAQVRATLAALPVTEADVDGAAGIVLAGDEAPEPGGEPWATLLPALDPTPMGWHERRWFLGEHGPVLFDRSGNIGPTVWWDGRIVGGWAQRRDGEIGYRLLEDIGAEAAGAIEDLAGRLTGWLAGVRVTPRFRTPLDRELSG